MTVTYVVIGIVVLVVRWGVMTYNGLISRRNKVDESWSGIDVMLKRRHDLVPNLVETVKGYAAHEREVLENVIRARTGAEGARTSGDVDATQQAENMLTGTLRQLFALSEAYPDLKANDNFRELQGQLAEVEDDIQASRRIYNSNVTMYNNKVQQVPSNIVAGMGNFTTRQFFEIENPVEREVVKVSFSS